MVGSWAGSEMPSGADAAASWLRVDVGFPAGVAPDEAAWPLLAELARRGLVLQDDPPRATFFLPPGSSPDWEPVAAAAARWGAFPAGWPRGWIDTQPIAQQDWAEMWKQGYSLLRAGSLVVVPSWISYRAAPGESQVRLEPGMGFGTGSHATTLGCLNLIHRVLAGGPDPRPETFLDVGTGSGILSLAALALGVDRAWGVDEDPVALANASQNAALNGVGVRLQLLTGRFPAATSHLPPADLVAANLDPVQLVDLAPHLARALAPNGWLVCSGFVRSQAELVLEALGREGLALQERADRDEWSACLLRGSGVRAGDRPCP